MLSATHKNSRHLAASHMKLKRNKIFLIKWCKLSSGLVVLASTCNTIPSLVAISSHLLPFSKLTEMNKKVDDEELVGEHVNEKIILQVPTKNVGSFIDYRIYQKTTGCSLRFLLKCAIKITRLEINFWNRVIAYARHLQSGQRNLNLGRFDEIISTSKLREKNRSHVETYNWKPL